MRIRMATYGHFKQQFDCEWLLLSTPNIIVVGCIHVPHQQFTLSTIIDRWEVAAPGRRDLVSIVVLHCGMGTDLLVPRRHALRVEMGHPALEIP